MQIMIRVPNNVNRRPGPRFNSVLSRLFAKVTQGILVFRNENKNPVAGYFISRLLIKQGNRRRVKKPRLLRANSVFLHQPFLYIYKLFSNCTESEKCVFGRCLKVTKFQKVKVPV